METEPITPGCRHCRYQGRNRKVGTHWKSISWRFVAQLEAAPIERSTWLVVPMPSWSKGRRHRRHRRTRGLANHCARLADWFGAMIRLDYRPRTPPRIEVDCDCSTTYLLPLVPREESFSLSRHIFNLQTGSVTKFCGKNWKKNSSVHTTNYQDNYMNELIKTVLKAVKTVLVYVFIK